VQPQSYDASQIRGRLIINGSDEVETNGDRVIIHNQQGVSDPSRVINRVSPRMIQVGEDRLGNPIFKQDTDPDTGKLLYDAFLSLEGLGIPTGIGNDTVPFYGIQLQGIEEVELRLADGNDHVLVSENEYRGSASVNQVISANGAPAGIDISGPNHNEVQTLTLIATSGIFTLNFNGSVTSALAFDISASALQSAL